MYHTTLKIAIFSENPLLEEEIRAIKPLARFTHEISAMDKFVPSSMAKADISIIDVPTGLSMSDVRARARANAILVCCMTEAEEEQLGEDEIACLDDVWLSPLRVPRIRLRMRHLLQEIKREVDARHHMIWLDTLIDSMPDLVWFKDLDGIHHKVNSKFCDFVKKSRDNVVGEMHAHIWDIPPAEAEKGEFNCRKSENEAIATGHTILTDEIVKSGDEKHLLKTYKTPLKGPDGEIFGTVGFAHDLTNLLNLDMELNLFIESMPFPLALCNNDDSIRQVNSCFLEFFGEDKNSIVGSNFISWMRDKLHPEVSPVNGEQFFRIIQDNGRIRHVNMTRKNILDIFDKKVGCFKIFRDITAEKELEIRIWNDANTDYLTGLANRHAFGHFVEKLRQDSKVHLIYIDLDAFKAVNDRWGHKAGDEALRIVAKAIRNVFVQDFPVRLGGDEFLICVQRDVPLSELENLAARLLRKIQEDFTASNHLTEMSASIGIRPFGNLADGVENLIRQADVAMYAAKLRGKAQYCIWNEQMETYK